MTRKGEMSAGLPVRSSTFVTCRLFSSVDVFKHRQVFLIVLFSSLHVSLLNPWSQKFLWFTKSLIVSVRKDSLTIEFYTDASIFFHFSFILCAWCAKHIDYYSPYLFLTLIILLYGFSLWNSENRSSRAEWLGVVCWLLVAKSAWTALEPTCLNFKHVTTFGT